MISYGSLCVLKKNAKYKAYGLGYSIHLLYRLLLSQIRQLECSINKNMCPFPIIIDIKWKSKEEGILMSLRITRSVVTLSQR